ncbi:hypothetical protein BKA56DRAFT_676946 [Ilyonectria sp. MPI-CAGE-AT-0026]|nr:hypothetical protein BKA56DRAFT_676946 [Ilyonectria sp. MPI-CAGE-AT-0026]
MPAKKKIPRGMFALFPDTTASKNALGAKTRTIDFSNLENPLWQKKRGFKRSIPVKLYRKYGLTLISFGRRGTWKIDDEKVADIQCSFEIDRLTGEILLYDRSPDASTVLLGDKDAAFWGSPRRVVVNKKEKFRFGFPGGTDGFEWTISWPKDPPFPPIQGPRSPRGRLPHTISGLPADRARSKTLYARRISQTTRVLPRRLSGTRSSSDVFKAIKKNSGGFFAVKDFRLQRKTWDYIPKIKAMVEPSSVARASGDLLDPVFGGEGRAMPSRRRTIF